MNCFKNVFIKILCIGLVFTNLTINAQDSLDINKIEEGVDKYLRYFSDDNPGAVVAVMKKGEIIFNKAYGKANLENGEVMTIHKAFNLAELSKSFTAVAILKLVEKNKLNLDNTIKDVFPEFPEYGMQITIRNILDHKSGLMSFNADQVSSKKEVYEFLTKQNKTAFEPGSKFMYSNSDYAFLANIIEEASGMTYQAFLKKYVFKKLSMNNSFFINEIANNDIAESHFKEGDTYMVKKEYSNILGEQGIFMTALDYARYDKMLYTNKILECENLSKIFKIGKLSNKENMSDYSCGWALMAKNGVRYFWQGGLQDGYTNLVLHLPDSQLTVLILTNRNDGYDFLKMAIYIAKLFDKGLKL